MRLFFIAVLRNFLTSFYYSIAREKGEEERSALVSGERGTKKGLLHEGGASSSNPLAWVASSVMEEADVGHCHGDAVFVAGRDDVVVADRAAALRDVGDAALMGTLHVVAEREERI